MKSPIQNPSGKTLAALAAACLLAPAAPAATYTWNGSSDSVWTNTGNYTGSGIDLTAGNSLDFGSITTAGTTTLSAAAGTYTVANLAFSNTASTITGAETLLFNGNGTAGQVVLNLSGNITVASPSNTRILLGSDLTINLSNALHAVAFTQNSSITSSATNQVLVINSLLTGGGSSAIIYNNYSTYGNTGSTALQSTPAMVFTNNASTFDAKLGTSTNRIYAPVGFTSIANIGVASSLGSASAANATIVLGNGGSLQFLGSGAQTTNRTIQFLGQSSLYNLSTTGGSLSYTGGITNIATTSSTYELRLGANAGTSLYINSVIADSATSPTRVSSYTNISGLTTSGTYTTYSLTGTTFLTAANTYTGYTDISGVINVSNLADINVASSLGKGSATGSAADIYIGGNGAILQYTGNTAQSTNRLFTIGDQLAGQTAAIEASGSLPSATLSFTGTGSLGLYAKNSAHSLTLTGTNTGRNLLAPSLSDYSTYATSLIKSGSGVWVLTGSNTYTGTTTVGAGILVFGKKSAKGTGIATGSSGAAIGLGVGSDSAYYTSADVDSLFANTLSGFTLNTGAGVAIDTTAGDFTYATSQANNRALTKLGANTLTLTGANTFTAVTTVNEGTLQIGDGTSGSIASDTVVAQAGTLAFNQANGGSYSGAISNQGAVKFTSSNRNTLSGIISGTGSLTQQGTGKTILTAANTYTGATNITQGELAINGSLSTSSAVNISSGATLSGSGRVGNVLVGGTLAGTLTTGTLSGSGVVSPGNSPGILTASSLAEGNSLSFAFELSTATPNYANATGSLNDILHLTDTTAGLHLSNLNNISIYFSGLTSTALTPGNFEGTFYVEGHSAASLLSAFESANVTYYVVDGDSTIDATDVTFNGVRYSVLSHSFVEVTGSDYAVSTFGTGNSASTLEFTVVPEPGTWAMLLGGLGMLAFGQRLRRQS